jgi:transcriptional regulator with XRE-family HTH domain
MRTRSPAHAAVDNAIREIRKRHGISQAALAEECGLDRTYISGIERGQRNPSLTNILKIAGALGTPASQISPAPSRSKPPATSPNAALPIGLPMTPRPALTARRTAPKPKQTRCSPERALCTRCANSLAGLGGRGLYPL